MYCGVDGFTTHQIYNTDSKFKPRSSWRHDAGSLHQGRHQAGDERAEPSWLSRCWTREQTWNDSVTLVCQKSCLNTWEGIWTFLHCQCQYFWHHQLYVANTPLEYVGLTPLDALVLNISKFYKILNIYDILPKWLIQAVPFSKLFSQSSKVHCFWTPNSCFSSVEKCWRL